MQLDAKTEGFWNAYLESLPQANDARHWFYEVFRIGDTAQSANDGAALIRDGVKTTTSSLLWAYEAAGMPIPEAGSLSIVADGEGEPVCVVQTTAVEIKALADVDAAFAFDYGEWDRTLGTWRAHCLEFNTPRCHALGKTPTDQMPLVCERFIVVYP